MSPANQFEFPGVSRSLPRQNTAEATFMASVYRWMALGLGLTAMVAYGLTASGLVYSLEASPGVFMILLLAELGLVFGFTRALPRASFAVAAGMLLTYCALSGVTFSVILLRYTGESIYSTLFVTGGTFAGMSAYGTLTKKDLSGWGSFLMMGLWGMILAGIVNIFLRSDMVGFVMSCMGVVVFTGLTAYDTQKIRQFAVVGEEKLALQGALMLYLDFVNLFLSLLRLFGRRRA